MKYLVWILVAVLIIAHQDFWFWETHEFVFGFLPIGLAYHIGLSIAAACVWYLAVKYAWPDDLETAGSNKEVGDESA